MRQKPDPLRQAFNPLSCPMAYRPKAGPSLVDIYLCIGRRLISVVCVDMKSSGRIGTMGLSGRYLLLWERCHFT